MIDPVPRVPIGTELPDVMALKAVAAGNADEDQQKRFMEWLIRTVCGTYGMPFDPSSERISNLNEGKRYVGWVCVNLLNMPVDTFKEYMKKEQIHDARGAKPGTGSRPDNRKRKSRRNPAGNQ